MAELIFISIASYRDPDTQKTIDNLIASADKPQNLRIGVVEQNAPSDRFSVRSQKPGVLVLRNIEAKGPAWARYLASTLWSGEEYYLQIDSHMTFIHHWDTIIIQDINRLRNRRVVLTCYPPASLPDDSTPVSSITQNWNFDHQNHIIAVGSILPATPGPQPGVFVSAGFLFFRSQPFLDEIPFDPNLKYLFQGEEILLSARLYTHGYTVYHPSRAICSHDYIRQDKPKVWNNNPDFWSNNKVAVRRYRHLTHQLKDVDHPLPNLYGEGYIHTIGEWKKRIKLDPEHLFD
ncbi:MAG: hypothetical protein CMM25_01335 [Rhodospirillaceae bacterium]|nr:hypothetical protein [Rhodospirillaceae bacterium]